ncbi:hypothetical protein [Flavobacterium sp. LAR06]|uniref:hypothetical protein n=1 Tax=Flavobacterium sp. LAR06 TaxID=3064897 RepID=UPI0035C23445
MQQRRTIRELFKQKYQYPISLLSISKTGKPNYLLNTDNGSFFAASGSICTFRDEDGNIWSTIPETVTVNGVRCFPVEGIQYILDGGVQCTFVPANFVVARAKEYFEKFAYINYGIEIKLNSLLFFYEGNLYLIDYQLFKLKIHDNMGAFQSYN